MQTTIRIYYSIYNYGKGKLQLKLNVHMPWEITQGALFTMENCTERL